MNSVDAGQRHSRHKRGQAPAITGLAVKLPTPCSCGSHAATIAADHVLECKCGRRRNPLSQRTAEFLQQIVGSFGAPVTPVILRRNQG
jgi:hypothetical protein